MVAGSLGAPGATAMVTATSAAPTSTVAGSPLRPTATGSGRVGTPGVDWDSPTAGILFYQGRGYRLAGQTPTTDVPWHADGVIGRTALRWQTGGVFPAGTPISSVVGQPVEQMLAIQTGERTTFFREDGETTFLFASTQVVLGTIKSFGPPLCAWSGCLGPPPGQRATGSVSTPATISVDRVVQGLMQPGVGEIEVRQMGAPDETLPNARPVPLMPGSTVLLFLQPGQLGSVGDFGPGDYYWTGPHWIYSVEQGHVAPLGLRDNGDPAVPLAEFLAGVAEVFRAVTPRDPYGPRPTPVTLPAATTPVPTMPAPTPGGYGADGRDTPTPAIGPTSTP